MTKLFRRALAALTAATTVTAIVVAGAFVAPATATGGKTIATAPAVAWGVQGFGNTSNGTSVDGCLQEYWLLSVVAGDHLTINWEVQSPDQIYTHLHIYPVGTDDFNVGDTDPIGHFTLNSNLKAQSELDVPVTGTMPMAFYANCETPGPYDFTAYVQHSVAVSLQTVSHIPLKGSLGVTASSPDGAGITAGVSAALQVKQSGSPWLTVGSAALTAAPTAVPYKIPASLNGRRLSLRAVVSGPGYATKGSASQKVKVGSKPRVTLAAAKNNVVRLTRARLHGKATPYAAGAKVTLFQRQASGGGWVFEGTTRTASDGRFRYSEVVHAGDRYYKACVRTTCSQPVFVHVVT